MVSGALVDELSRNLVYSVFRYGAKRKLILHYCPVFVIKGIAHKEHLEQIEIWCFFEFFFTLFLFLILDFRAVV